MQTECLGTFGYLWVLILRLNNSVSSKASTLGPLSLIVITLEIRVFVSRYRNILLLKIFLNFHLALEAFCVTNLTPQIYDHGF